ncbi:MAG: triphosphoribosyl-dephospho-CoA synthase [Gemmatimonadaceae bacterium]
MTAPPPGLAGAGDAERPRAGVSRPGGGLLEAEDVGVAAQLACLLEASAPKPGNVSPGRHFRDARYEEFLASAAAVGPAMSGAGGRPLGETVRLAVETTARWTRSNTNLGIVLLLAPLARAALTSGRGGPWPRAELRATVRAVLDGTTVGDARDVYAAIRLAAPGGLGRAEAQDVATEPTVTLAEAMRLAADRDGVAREYATAFATTFELAAPALERALGDGLPWDDAVVELYLTLLAAAPDTHVARRAGPALAGEVARRARAAVKAGGVRSAAGRVAVAELDRALRDERNRANPGTTADLTAAAAFVVLLGGAWHSFSEGGGHGAAR